MTLDQWLREATGIFPAGVQHRLAQEYRAHLEDSASAGGPDDPVELFGSPDAVQRQLEKTYVNAGRMNVFRGRSEASYWLVTVLLALSSLDKIKHAPVYVAPELKVGVVAVLWVLLWALTARWQAVRRGGMRRGAVWALFMALQILLPIRIPQGTLDLNVATLLSTCLQVAMGIGLVISFGDVWREQTRLRRTLELERLEGTKA